MQWLVFKVFILFLLPFFAFAHENSPHGDLIIRMTENGFEPKELIVSEGEEVLFINNSDTDRWPASNLHPTHSLYPEFDPLKEITPGGSWKMRFTNSGTWKMHDHLIPHFTGTIIVLEDTDELSTTSAGAVRESLWEKLKRFLSKLFSNVNNAEGVALDDHGKAHLKGQELFNKYGIKGLSKCTTEAAFGCYHGFTESIFTNNSEDEYARNILDVESACLSLGELGSGPNASCIHGIGHGVATYREHDLDKVLRDCNRLNARIRTYCYDGAFMEFSISAPANFYKESSPLYPCDILESSYKSACTRSQVTVMQNKFKMGTNAIAKACIENGDPIIISNCVDSLGFSIAQSSPNNPRNIVSQCNEIGVKEYAAKCMAAAAGELVFQDYAGWQNNAPEICMSLTGNEKMACQERIDRIKKDYGRN